MLNINNIAIHGRMDEVENGHLVELGSNSEAGDAVRPSEAFKETNDGNNFMRVRVTKSKIPTYLRSTPFYEGLHDDDSEPIDLNPQHLKSTPDIHNSDDLRHYISTILFWNTRLILTEELLLFCFCRSYCFQAVQVCREFDQFKEVNELCTIIESCFPTEEAAKLGNLACLRAANEAGFRWSGIECSLAALHGHLDCLVYAHEHGSPWDQNTCQNAAVKNHLGCLQYAYENGCPWDAGYGNLIQEIIRAGAVDCLDYVLKHMRTAHERHRMVEMCLGFKGESRAAIQLLQCCHTHGGTFSDYFLISCVFERRYEYLLYALDHGVAIPPYTITEALIARRKDIVAELRARGVPWEENTFARVFRSERVDVDLLEECLQLNVPLPQGKTLARVAAEENALAFLKIILEQRGEPYKPAVMEAALMRGSVHILRYLRKAGYPSAENLYMLAIRFDQLTCVEFLHEEGYPFDVSDEYMVFSLESAGHYLVKYLAEKMHINMPHSSEFDDQDCEAVAYLQKREAAVGH